MGLEEQRQKHPAGQGSPSGTASHCASTAACLALGAGARHCWDHSWALSPQGMSQDEPTGAQGSEAELPERAEEFPPHPHRCQRPACSLHRAWELRSPPWAGARKPRGVSGRCLGVTVLTPGLCPLAVCTLRTHSLVFGCSPPALPVQCQSPACPPRAHSQGSPAAAAGDLEQC